MSQNIALYLLENRLGGLIYNFWLEKLKIKL